MGAKAAAMAVQGSMRQQTEPGLGRRAVREGHLADCAQGHAPVPAPTAGPLPPWTQPAPRAENAGGQRARSRDGHPLWLTSRQPGRQPGRPPVSASHQEQCGGVRGRLLTQRLDWRRAWRTSRASCTRRSRRRRGPQAGTMTSTSTTPWTRSSMSPPSTSGAWAPASERPTRPRWGPALLAVCLEPLCSAHHRRDDPPQQGVCSPRTAFAAAREPPCLSAERLASPCDSIQCSLSAAALV